jgi:hypothetical protein
LHTRQLHRSDKTGDDSNCSGCLLLTGSYRNRSEKAFAGEVLAGILAVLALNDRVIAKQQLKSFRLCH